MDSEPHWARLLDYLYSSETGKVDPPIYFDDEEANVDEDHGFLSELGLKSEEVINGLGYLVDNELLVLIHDYKFGDHPNIDESRLDIDHFLEWRGSGRKRPLGEYSISLSQKGFDVAHEREISKLQIESQKLRKDEHRIQNNLNLTIAAFTVLLATGIVAQAFLMSPDVEGRVLYGAAATIAIGIIGAFAMYLNWGRLFWVAPEEGDTG